MVAAVPRPIAAGTHTDALPEHLHHLVAHPSIVLVLRVVAPDAEELALEPAS